MDEEVKTLNCIYLLVAILFGVVGAVQCFRWGSSGTITIWYAINFLPAFACLVAYAATQRVTRKTMHAITILLCVLIVGFWGFVTIGVESLIAATAEVTDVRKYDEILEKHWGSNSELVSHFPRPVPLDANDVRFSFLPAFLQGSAHIQLRYSATSAPISELYERFSAKKTRSFAGGDTNVHMNTKEGMPTTFFHTSGSKKSRGF